MTIALAINGGPRCITTPRPHDVWPPPGDTDELHELALQRQTDISIKGRTGIISEFEQQFLQFMDHKVKYALSFNSGTSALLAAYFAVGLDAGDEIIGPALTFHAALSPAFLLRATVRLVDVCYDTRCLDASQIEAAINQKTKAITVVHQWGHPANMDEIMRLARQHNLRVIEDCSHAHGSRLNGRLCGTFGDVAVFSLQAAKMIYAGEGGILVTNNQAYYERATLLGHYRDRSRDEIKTPALRKYWVTGFGQKLRMSPFGAVVAKHALRAFDARKAGRHSCLNYFRRRLQEVEYLDRPYVAPNVDMGAWYGFKPLYKKDLLCGVSIDTLVDSLQAEGMEIDRASAPVLATQPLYSDNPDLMFPNHLKNASKIEGNTPVASALWEQSLSLPTFTNWQRDKPIIDEYISAFNKVGSHFRSLR